MVRVQLGAKQIPTNIFSIASTEDESNSKLRGLVNEALKVGGGGGNAGNHRSNSLGPNVGESLAQSCEEVRLIKQSSKYKGSSSGTSSLAPPQKKSPSDNLKREMEETKS